MIEIRCITEETAQDLNLKNETFAMPGRLIPALRDGVWSYRTEMFEKPQTMTFPDENYDFETLSKNSVILGAYDGETCVGIAIYQDYYFGYMYLLDLKVSAAARGRGAGRALIEAGKQAARERGYQGLYCQAQDDNLNACLFYLKTGFEIGGFDNHVYQGTSQQGKADILFYTKQEAGK